LRLNGDRLTTCHVCSISHSRVVFVNFGSLPNIRAFFQKFILYHVKGGLNLTNLFLRRPPPPGLLLSAICIVSWSSYVCVNIPKLNKLFWLWLYNVGVSVEFLRCLFYSFGDKAWVVYKKNGVLNLPNYYDILLT
jgi:hypothetical protein